MKHEEIKKNIITGLCIALGVIIPIAFHSIPNGGQIFCPMHLPILLCGLICGWQYGLLCGIVTPMISSLITGMPIPPMLPSMAVELAIFGIVSALMIKYANIGNEYLRLYASLITAMVSGRIAASIVQALFFSMGQTIKMLAITHFVTCLPGIVIQLILIPAVYIALLKTGVITQQHSNMDDIDYYYYGETDEEE